MDLVLSRLASGLRARWWGLLIALLTDGLSTVTPDHDVIPLGARPRLPDGPLVVVANHGSHADSAALLATLGRDRPVRFVAAADYWGGARRWAATILMGIWPVRRGGHGWDDLAAAADLVRSGVVLVTYPEGTRSRDGALGDFHTGPFRLARLAGARVLPVAVAGTGSILPVHGRLHRGPVEVRWAPPLDVAEPAEAAKRARTLIAERLAVPVVPRPGRAWLRAASLAWRPLGMVLIFAWALAEGVSWPLLAETPLMVLAVTGTRRTPLLILSAVTGSLCGIVATWWLAWHGVHLPAPLTTPHMEAVATAQLSASPTGAFLAQTVNGIPVKVYAAAAGHLHLPLTELLWAVWPRLARTVVLGTAAFLTGRLLRRYLQPMLGAVEAAVVAGYPFALGMVVSRWR